MIFLFLHHNLCQKTADMFVRRILSCKKCPSCPIRLLVKAFGFMQQLCGKNNKAF